METIRNGLLIVRTRYGIPYCELPFCNPSDLGRFHLYLLGTGKVRPSIPFPRAQVLGIDGLCRLQRLCKRSRWELALTVASIKRNLPAGCRFHTPSSRSKWESNVSSQPPPTSPEYLRHVKRVTAQIFTSGWDSRYYSFVRNFVPNPSARKPRKSRADLLWSGQREAFLSACTEERELPPFLSTRYKEVPTAGKCRSLLIYDKWVDLLGPLHKLMYSRLMETEWLLCGPPTEKRISSVCTNEINTSVDLVAASDNLSHDVAEAILDVAFFSSLKIPRSLRSLAKASLSPEYRNMSGASTRVRHGQMMGAYLCFPLLCIQSYCAATWAARDDTSARFMVNGDDCVISTNREITVRDYPSGYRLNSEKTICAKDIVEVNSTVFLRSGGVWREVRHARRVGATTEYHGMLHMAEACSISRSWQTAFVQSRIGRSWGFLPSQLGFTSYPAYKREQGLLSSVRRRSYGRVYSELPRQAHEQDEEGLRRVSPGRPASTDERSELNDFFWKFGRKGGLKRDVFSPSRGEIRRTYRYRVQPYKYHLGFVAWAYRKATCARSSFFYLPEDSWTEEEKSGLMLLDLWRQAFDSLAIND